MKDNRTLWWLSSIYLVWLLAVLFIFGYTPTNDGLGYVEYAQWCLAEGAPYPTTSIYSHVPFVWNIGIINLTQLSLWLFNSITPLLVLLCVLKAGTALFTALTAQHLFGHRTAIAALLLFVLYPNNWGQSTMVSSEIPSTFLCVLAVFLIVAYGPYGAKSYRAYKSYKPYMLLLVGVLLGLANWFRPTATIFIVAIAAYLLLVNRQDAWQRHTARIATFIAGYALFIVVVGTSCYLRTGHFVYQSRSYWFSMVDECYDGAAVAPHWGQPVWPEGNPRYIEGHEQMDCFQFEQIWKQRSLDYLKDHKLGYLKKIPGRLFYMYQSDYDNIPFFLEEKADAAENYITIPFRHLLTEAGSLSRAQWLALICLLYYAALLVMAFSGSLRLFRHGCFTQLFLPLFIVVAGSLALVLVMHGETRFKDPLMPYLIMLSATAFTTKTSNSQ